MRKYFITFYVSLSGFGNPVLVMAKQDVFGIR